MSPSSRPKLMVSRLEYETFRLSTIFCIHSGATPRSRFLAGVQGAGVFFSTGKVEDRWEVPYSSILLL